MDWVDWTGLDWIGLDWIGLGAWVDGRGGFNSIQSFVFFWFRKGRVTKLVGLFLFARSFSHSLESADLHFCGTFQKIWSTRREAGMEKTPRGKRKEVMFFRIAAVRLAPFSRCSSFPCVGNRSFEPTVLLSAVCGGLRMRCCVTRFGSWSLSCVLCL